MQVLFPSQTQWAWVTKHQVGVLLPPAVHPIPLHLDHTDWGWQRYRLVCDGCPKSAEPDAAEIVRRRGLAMQLGLPASVLDDFRQEHGCYGSNDKLNGFCPLGKDLPVVEHHAGWTLWTLNTKTMEISLYGVAPMGYRSHHHSDLAAPFDYTYTYYRFPNSSNSVCFGEGNKVKALRDAVNLYWTSPFNNDLGVVPERHLHFSQFDWAEDYRDEDTWYDSQSLETVWQGRAEGVEVFTDIVRLLRRDPQGWVSTSIDGSDVKPIKLSPVVAQWPEEDEEDYDDYDDDD